MSNDQLKLKLKELEDRLRQELKSGGNETLNQIFRITAQQLKGPENCRRRHCRNSLLCYAKHAIGADCSAFVPTHIYETMANNMAVMLAMRALQRGEPIELPHSELMLLLAHVAATSDLAALFIKADRHHRQGKKQKP